jgi:thiol-disulfide isomerase/thioredoxin
VRALIAALAVLAASATGYAEKSVTALDLRVVRPDGSTATVHDVIGDGPALVVFWATYCAPCRAEVPVVNRAVERWRDKGLRVLGVDLETDTRRMRDAREEWGMRYEVMAIAPDQEAATAALLPRGLPACAVAARGAAIIHESILDDAAIENLVVPLLERRSSAQ